MICRHAVFKEKDNLLQKDYEFNRKHKQTPIAQEM